MKTKINFSFRAYFPPCVKASEGSNAKEWVFWRLKALSSEMKGSVEYQSMGEWDEAYRALNKDIVQVSFETDGKKEEKSVNREISHFLKSISNEFAQMAVILQIENVNIQTTNRGLK